MVMRAIFPRWLIFPLIIIFATSVVATFSQPHRHDPTFVAMVRLLEWRDPVSGELLNLPIDRTAPLTQQVIALQNVEELYLPFNQLSELPPEVGNLVNLQVLFLESNQLSALPPELGNLANLEWLYLGNNPLTELPPEITQLPNLWIVQ